MEYFPSNLLLIKPPPISNYSSSPSTHLLYFFSLISLIVIFFLYFFFFFFFLSFPPARLLFTVFAAPLTDPRIHPPAASKFFCLCLLFAAVPSATAVRARKPKASPPIPISPLLLFFHSSNVHTQSTFLSTLPPLLPIHFRFLYSMYYVGT